MALSTHQQEKQRFVATLQVQVKGLHLFWGFPALPLPRWRNIWVLHSPGGLAEALRSLTHGSLSYCPSQPRSALCLCPLLVGLRPCGRSHLQLCHGQGQNLLGRPEAKGMKE